MESGCNMKLERADRGLGVFADQQAGGGNILSSSLVRSGRHGLCSIAVERDADISRDAAIVSRWWTSRAGAWILRRYVNCFVSGGGGS